MHDGQELTTRTDIGQVFVDYYKGVFGQCIEHKVQLHWEELFPSTSWDFEDLERPFTENEVRLAIFSMGGDKSPGPDGFLASFFQTFWDVIKKDVMDLFEEFYRGTLEIDLIMPMWFLFLKEKVLIKCMSSNQLVC